MVYTPKKNNKVTSLIFLFGMLVLFVIFLLCQFGIFGQVVFHFAFYIEAIFFSFILIKFVLPIYQYQLIDNRFKIIKTLGSKAVTECDIDFCKIEKIITKSEYKKENAKIRSVYNYNANFPAFSSYYLVFSYSDCYEAVMFQPDDTMVKEIEKIISDKSLSF